MELVKIGKKLWRIAVIRQIRQNFLPPMFFTIRYVLSCMGPPVLLFA